MIGEYVHPSHEDKSRRTEGGGGNGGGEGGGGQDSGGVSEAGDGGISGGPGGPGAHKEDERASSSIGGGGGDRAGSLSTLHSGHELALERGQGKRQLVAHVSTPCAAKRVMTQGVGDVTLTMAAAAVPVPAQANEGEGQHATCFASTQAPPGLEAVVKSDDPADNGIRADDPTASSFSAALASNGQGDVQPTSLACYRAATTTTTRRTELNRDSHRDDSELA